MYFWISRSDLYSPYKFLLSLDFYCLLSCFYLFNCKNQRTDIQMLNQRNYYKYLQSNVNSPFKI